MRYLPILLLGCLIGCGSGGGDDTVEDNRVCITNVNNNPVVNVEGASEEALEEGFEVIEEVVEVPVLGNQPGVVDLDPAGNQTTRVNICGTSTEVDAVVTNPNGREDLAAFFTYGEAL